MQMKFDLAWRVLIRFGAFWHFNTGYTLVKFATDIYGFVLSLQTDTLSLPLEDAESYNGSLKISI